MMKIYSALLLFFLIFSAGLSAQNSGQVEKQLQGKWILKDLDVKNSERGLSPEEYLRIKDAFLYASPLKLTTLTFKGNNFVATQRDEVAEGHWLLQGNVLVMAVTQKDDSNTYKRQFTIKTINDETLALDYARAGDAGTIIETIFNKQP